MDERSGLGAPHAATALQVAQAEWIAELAERKRAFACKRAGPRASSDSSASSSSELSQSPGLAAAQGAGGAKPSGAAAGAAGVAGATGANVGGAPLTNTGGLFVAGLDDVSFARQWQEMLLFVRLGADMTRSRAIGGTREEQLGFVSFALGQVDLP